MRYRKACWLSGLAGGLPVAVYRPRVIVRVIGGMATGKWELTMAKRVAKTKAVTRGKKAEQVKKSAKSVKGESATAIIPQ